MSVFTSTPWYSFSNMSSNVQFAQNKFRTLRVPKWLLRVAAIEASGSSSSGPLAWRSWNIWQHSWHCRAASLPDNQVDVAMIGWETYSLWSLSVSPVWCQQQQWVRQRTRLMSSVVFRLQSAVLACGEPWIYDRALNNAGNNAVH